MVSRSYSNLLELASGESPSFGLMNRRIPRIMTVAGLITDVDDDDPLESVCSDPSSSSDFVLCIGDDRSDEDMFEVITSSMSGPTMAPRAEVFACTVGRKPSKAKYYLDDTTDIVRMVQGLA